MAFNLLVSIFLLFSLLCTKGFSVRDLPNNPKASPFEFINNLKGCRKGNNTKEVHQLKHYLHKFGYLHNQNQTYLNNDEYDHTLETAVKTYQLNFHVTPTGIIDDETASRITSPRCGAPDIINGTNFMQSRKQKESNSNTFHTVAHYRFIEGNPRWPSSQTHLTYGFLPNMLSEAIGPVAQAFSAWASVSQFTFSQAQGNENADLVIGFYSGDHGDGAPFEGPGRTLAHAFPPTDGRFHYDADESWSVGPVEGSFDLETLAIHEIGHLLGLGHSDVEDAIMFPTFAPGVTKGLNADDINGIRALYSI